MKAIKSFGYSLAVVSVLSFGLVGCGGGSDSSDSGLSFPSNAVIAEPTIANGEKVEEVVTENQQDIYSLSAVSSANAQNVALTMKDINDLIGDKVNTDFYALNETINETIPCSTGSINYSGSGTETGGATVTATFNSCVEDGMSIDGKIQIVLSNYDATYDDYTTTATTFVTTLSLNYDGLSITISQGSNTKTEIREITGQYEADVMKMSMSVISDVNGIKNGQENAVYYFDTSDYYALEMYQTQGKIYFDNLASYVEYDTSHDMSLTPFVFDSGDLISGTAKYIMSNGANLKIEVDDNGDAIVSIDVDGDGNYELVES